MSEIPVTLPPVHDQQAFMAADVAEAPPWHRLEFGFNSERADGAIACIVDTGFDQVHCEAGGLKGAVLKHRNFSDSNTHWARHPHGTHVAGILQTIAPGVKLLSAKGLGDMGGGTDAGLAAGIRWGVDEGADVINVSAGAPVPSEAIKEACEYAAKHKVLVIAASGNEGSKTLALSSELVGALAVSWPAAFDSTVAVGAIDRNRKLAAFSNQGLKVQCVAPGVGILSLGLFGSMLIQSGTSMAAPWVAGLATILKAIKKDMGLDLFSDLIEQCCDDLDTAGRDKATGWGVPLPPKFLAILLPPPVSPPPVVPPGLQALVQDGTPAKVLHVDGELGIFIRAK